MTATELWGIVHAAPPALLERIEAAITDWLHEASALDVAELVALASGAGHVGADGRRYPQDPEPPAAPKRRRRRRDAVIVATQTNDDDGVCVADELKEAAREERLLGGQVLR